MEALEGRALLSTLTVQNAADSGQGSLRATIAAAAAGDLIVFAHRLDGQTIKLTGGELMVNRSINIEGPGAQNLSISGGGNSRVIDVSGGATLHLSGLAITAGAADSGGAILDEDGSTLDITQSTLSNNQATGDLSGDAQGGAIFNAAGAKLSIFQSLVTGNQTNGINQSFGGAVYNQGSATIVGSTFKNNSAVGSETLSFFSVGGSMGGAIMNDDGSTMTVSQSSFIGNQAVGAANGDAMGGAIDNDSWNIAPVGVTVSITTSSFTGNVADAGANAFDGGFGGAIEDLPGTTIAVSGTAFAKNQATANPPTTGAVFSLADGGAIDDGGDGDFFPPISGAPDITVTVAACSFIANSATGGAGVGNGVGNFGGGGAVNWGFSNGSISDSSFVANQAIGEAGSGRGGEAQGGAIYATSMLSITNCALIGNQAVGGFNGGFAEGGGIEAYGGLTATACILIGNQAIGGNGGPNTGPRGFFSGYAEGGGINLLGENPFGSVVTGSLTDSVLIGNQAKGGDSSSGRGGFADGGAIDANSMTLSLENDAILGNSATGGQGAAGAQGGYAFGGGLDIEEASVANVIASTFAQNSATGGAGGSGGDGGVGLGGGIALGGVSFLIPQFSPDGSSLTLGETTLSANQAYGGAGSNGGVGGDGSGGGLAVAGQDTAAVAASVFAGNLVQGGGGSSGGNGFGGGLYIDTGSSASFTRSTITGNQAKSGAGSGGESAGQGIGGGVYSLGTFTSDKATTIRKNHASTSNNDLFSS